VSWFIIFCIVRDREKTIFVLPNILEIPTLFLGGGVSGLGTTSYGEKNRFKNEIKLQ
jgi:hypothetical protein